MFKDRQKVWFMFRMTTESVPPTSFNSVTPTGYASAANHLFNIEISQTVKSENLC